MRSILRYAAAAVAVGILGAAAAGAETMDLATARKAALERSRAVVRAESAVREAELAEKIAAADFLPSVSASASWSASVADGAFAPGDPTASLSASQNLFSGGAKVNALRSARLATNQAREDLRAERIAVLAEIDSRFFGALEKDRSWEAAVVAREAAEKQLEIAGAKKEAGTIAEADFLQTQSSWATKKTAETQAKWAAETSARSLASYLGRRVEPEALDDGAYGTLAKVVGARAEADLEGLVKKLYEKGLATDPSLRKKEAAIAIAELAVKTKKAAFFPTVSVSASLGASSADGAIAASDPTIKLSASIPIFPFSGRTAAVETAKLGEMSARSTVADAQDELLLSFYSTTLEALSAAGQIDSAAAALKYAEANYALAAEKFKLGTGTQSAVTDAESTLATARAQDISARFDLYASIAALSRLIGAEDEQGLADALAQ